jgi:hypothetical protein
MKRTMALLSLVVVLSVAAMAQASQFKSMKAACGACCGGACDPTCCQSGCAGCCK